MGEVDGAEAHLQKLTSFPLERSQRTCSRGLTCSNLPHHKSRRAECGAAKPAGAEELLHHRGVAVETLAGQACPRAAAERARGGWASHKVCWIMPTARGNMLEVRAPSPAPSWPLPRRAIIRTVAGLKRQNLQMYEEKNN